MAKALDTNVVVKWTSEEQAQLQKLLEKKAKAEEQKASDGLASVQENVETFGKFWTLAERRQICRALEIEIVADTVKGTKQAGDGKPKKYKLLPDAGEGLAGAEWSGIGITKTEFAKWDLTQNGKDWHKNNKEKYPLNPAFGA